MSARTPAEIARKNAIAAMMPLLRHYASHGLASVRAPLPAELELPAAEIENLSGLDVLKLVVENQARCPFSER